MSSTSPSDLATTFRSIPRRLKEAQGKTPSDVTAAHTSAIDRHLSTAGSLLHTSADPSSIASAIEAIPADAWDDATLDQLRSIALEMGSGLRSIAAANPDAD
ncbi:MAG: hypothetical protein JWN99_2856 [Ilumatobacteraceae bacterium]|nr:hypothetical protein [Ilumatobacteraceae bacterium]